MCFHDRLCCKGIIDLKEEKNRLEKNLKKINNEMSKINIKLNDDNFMKNAPKNIIDEQMQRKEEYQKSKDKLENAIKSIE